MALSLSFPRQYIIRSSKTNIIKQQRFLKLKKNYFHFILISAVSAVSGSSIGVIIAVVIIFLIISIATAVFVTRRQQCRCATPTEYVLLLCCDIIV